MTDPDLRAAVATGILTEAQAARLTALTNDRAAQRAALPHEDEPFEFFRGFAEIFISIGLIILFTGISMALAWVGGFAMLTLIPALTAALAWWAATYFTLKRRMTLPSMVLATAFGVGITITSFTVLNRIGLSDLWTPVASFFVATMFMVLWYRQLRLPFSAFLVGLFALATIYSLTAVNSTPDLLVLAGGWRSFFDLGTNPVFAINTLLFGIGAFHVGLWFDMRDPHRLGRHSATAFWCHLLAAPALVNTVAVSLLNTGGTSGVVLLILALVVITLMALIIDRRSFLTAAIVYIAIVMSWFVGDTADFGTRAYVLILLGALITAIGTWWVQLRAALMRALPDFPGKSRLPPYGSTE